ncbi:hypothetical protein RUM44_011080 [Polyplax serrata]|uniref:Bis(5'-adenosyl)-triphosphatase n=1 Tax=Polyplax serrata TaxID=468196 RepID=A0ABR1ANZ3_POLSC
MAQPTNNLVAVCQMTATNDKEKNYKIVEDLVIQAKRANASIAFLPEGCDFIGTSKSETLSLAEPLDGHSVARYQELARKLNIWLSLGGIHEYFSESKLYNTHLMISGEGDIVGKYHKMHLFDVEIPEQNVKLMESSYVEKGNSIPEPVPTPVGNVGLSICYDMRFAELALTLAKMGAHVLTYPSAFTFATGANHWETILKARAIETQCYVVAAAQVGVHNPKRSTWGHAMVVDPWGSIVAQCSEGQGIAIAEIKTDYLCKVRLNMPVWQHRRTDLYPSMLNLSGCENNVFDKDFYTFGQVKISKETIFYKTNLSFAFTNKKCVVPGHVLVAPLREVKYFSELTPEEVADLFQTSQMVSKIMSHIHGTTSSTIVVQDGPEAGQTITHVHVHVLPRRAGDFEQNDDIYTELSNHDKRENVVWRSEEEMSAEASVIKSAINENI